MGLVYTEITLKNAIDVANAGDGIVKEQDIRQTTVEALVDSGAWTLVINETVRKKLGLEATRNAPGTLADGTRSSYKLAGPVEVQWKDRITNCDAIVLPDAKNVLLGAIPLEGMDLTINPHREEVVGIHGDQMLFTI